MRTEKGEKDWGEDTQQGAAVEAVATAEDSHPPYRGASSLPAQLPGHPTVCVFVCDFSTLLSSTAVLVVDSHQQKKSPVYIKTVETQDRLFVQSN